MIFLKPIAAKYFELVEEKITLHDFDNWILTNDGLETELGESLYIEVISLNYSDANTTYELSKLLKNHFDNGEFETLRLLELLEVIITRKGKEAEALIRIYDLYCTCYDFLKLGVDIGLHIAVPYEYGVQWFHELTERQQVKIVDKHYPLAKTEAKKMKKLLLDKTIVLTGKKGGEYDYLQYLDKRKK
ncbi:MAG: hypothetical protein AB8G11_24305 [Saprospiraceae bacterium]